MTSTIIRPNGAGIQSAWTASAGSNYQCVDESSANDDTDYVSTATQFTTDEYDFEDLSLAAGSVITLVTMHVRARKTTTGTSQSIYGMPYDPSNTTYYYPIEFFFADNTNYHDFSHSMALNPRTGLPWTESEVNAEQFGFAKADAEVGTLRVTQMYVTVLSEIYPLVPKAAMPMGLQFGSYR